MSPIRLLIVDDSRVFRAVIEDALRDESGIEVVGSVWSGEKALEVLPCLDIDVVTLDIEMPGIGGLETLRRIQAYNQSAKKNVGVIMISSHTRAGATFTLNALELGAFDFLPKPAHQPGDAGFSLFRNQLSRRIHGCATRPLHAEAPPRIVVETPILPKKEKAPRAILIGISTGGPKALNQMLPRLSALVDCPILIVQHMPPVFTQTLAQSLDALCTHHVCEAEEGMIVEGRRIYIAPGGKHLTVRREGANIVTGINEQPPENGCRPSVDVLFRSASQAYSGEVVATIMTGMGNDGSASLYALKRAGARIVAQDEASSIVWGMPGAAVRTGTVEVVASLDKLPETIASSFVCHK